MPKTSSGRQDDYLSRLHGEKEGLRFSLDFDGERMKDLALLLDLGYGANRSEAIRRAVKEVADNLRLGRCLP